MARAFVEKLEKEGVPCRAEQFRSLDITDPERLEEVLDEVRPGVVLNCAAYNRVDEAENSREQAFRVNSDAVRHMARLCNTRKIFLVHFSSDYVFDGTQGTVYKEEDRPNPVNVYGASKLAGEKSVPEEMKDYLVFRLSWVFGEGENNFLSKLEGWDQEKGMLKIASGETSSPSYTRDIAEMVMLALHKSLRGLYHLCNSGFCARYEWARYYFHLKNKDIKPVLSSPLILPARRPAFSAMSNEKLSAALNVRIPDWQDAVKRFVEGSMKTQIPSNPSMRSQKI